MKYLVIDCGKHETLSSYSECKFNIYFFEKGDRGLTGPPGEKGDKGDKPIYGVDYFTEEDWKKILANSEYGRIEESDLEKLF